MKAGKLALYVLLMFTATYMMFGTKSTVWSGLYFVANYAIMIVLFLAQRDKYVRIFGVAVSGAILIFSVLKFFLSLDTGTLKVVNVITFSLIAVSLYKLEPK